MKILIVEDDQLVLDTLSANLQIVWPDCSVLPARDGRAALQGVANLEPDLVLLDLRLPGENGYDVLKRMRRLSDVPIVIITGRSAELDEVRGLQLGADDFIVKPFIPSILMARLKSLLRRAGRPARDRSVADRVAGDLAIDFGTHEVTLRGERVKLTPVEYKLLYHLARAPGRLISHRKLLELVWECSDSSALGRLHVYVKRLRDKIEDGGAPYIENERGLGYRFVHPPDVVTTPASAGQVPGGERGTDDGKCRAAECERRAARFERGSVRQHRGGRDPQRGGAGAQRGAGNAE